MNPASAGLLRAALLALLAWSIVLFSLASFGLGSRYALHPDDPEAMSPLPELALSRAESQLAPFYEYAVVADRPLFNPDRRPLPPSDAAPTDAAPPPVVAAPLDIVLTSVIVTGETRLAIVSDRAGGKSQSLKVGESLAGEQSSWKLVELQPRAAVFEGPGGRNRVDLRVFDGTGGQPPTPVAVPPTDTVDAQTTEVVDQAAEQSPESRAEMIRKRIEERRRQMREEAARANQERGK